ncbi:MAG: MoxR family ATPase [Dermatophilaceae bacterium]
MPLVPENAAWFADTFARLTDNIGLAVLGKAPVVRLTLTCLLAEGHMLLEDAPGTGKTALARALAATVQCSNSRIQFTPDLLPSDITGVTMYDQKRGAWEFHRGPVFTSIVLADEINRASPKTQSALLEIMGESQVTVDGTKYDAARPFMVIATQNPIEQAGTYRLPEAQLDRFLMKTKLGYPERAAAIEVLSRSATPDRAKDLRPIIATKAILEMIEMVKDNHIDPAVLDYVQRLVEATRDDAETVLGVSTRGAIAMVRAARVWAAAHGRPYVLPDDIKELADPVWTHRLVLSPDLDPLATSPRKVLGRVLDQIAAPRVSMRRT